jgi:hypothetical protein
MGLLLYLCSQAAALRAKRQATTSSAILIFGTQLWKLEESREGGNV